MTEAQVRLHLAAGRRILAAEGAGSGAFGFLAARHPSGTSVLVTPVGEPDALTAADVVSVPLDGPPAGVSAAAGIALAILRRRSDVGAVVHTHAPRTAVQSTARVPVGMYNEVSTLFFDEQVVVEDDGDRSALACEAMAAALGERRVLLLPGHGMIAASASVGDAVIDAVAFEKSSDWDIVARGYAGVPIVQAHVDQTKPLYDLYFRKNMWEANLRRLQRDVPELFEAARS